MIGHSIRHHSAAALVMSALALGWMFFGALPSAEAATIYVNTGCWIEHAIQSANDDRAPGASSCAAGSGHDTIDLSGWQITQPYTTAFPAITSSITIRGAGKTIRASGIRHFHVQRGHLRIENLTLTGGSDGGGGGGSVLVNSGASFTMTSSNINSSNASGDGGAIHSSGTLTIISSTIVGNSASGLAGGGGIYVAAGSATLTHVTLFNNSKSRSTANGGGLLVSGAGTAVYLRNSIIGDINGATTDCALINSASLRQNVGNVIENGGGNCNTDEITSLNIGVSEANKRGNPQIYPINAGSSANGRGDSRYCKQYFKDQLGYYRPDVGCDSGAAERDGFNNIFIDGVCELGRAIINANDGGQTYSDCRSGSNDAHAIDRLHLLVDQEISSGTQSVTSKIIVAGNGKTVSVASGSTARHFHVSGSGNLTLRDITLSGGSDSQGASVYSGGDLTMQDCVVKDATASDKGAGIFFWGDGTLTIDRCAFINNRASNLGGAMNIENGSPTVNISNSTFSENHGANGGGAMYIAAGTVTLGHLTLWNNTSGGSGFTTGIHGSATMYNSIIGRDTNQGGALCGSFNNGNADRGNIMWNGPTSSNPCDVVTVDDPKLGKLTGRIPYFPLPMVSPARRSGINAQCAAYPTDQRRAPRPASDCDIGAVQYAPPAPAAPAADPGPPKTGGCWVQYADGSWHYDRPCGETEDQQRPVCTGELLNETGAFKVSTTYGLCTGVQFNQLELSAIGIGYVIEAGPIAAVDVWGWVTAHVELCYRAQVSMLFLDAATSPRAVSPLGSVWDGEWTCGKISAAGTIVIMPAQSYLTTAPADAAAPSAPAAPGSPANATPFGQCMVTLNYILNLRQTPGGMILMHLPYSIKLTAFQRSGDWVEVDYHGLRGWLSARHVTFEGAC